MKWSVVGVAFAVLLLPRASLGEGPPASGPDLSDRLEEGIYLQEARGDFEGAVAMFREILGSEDSTVVAEAHYRLGLCYLEQGKDGLAMQTFSSLLKKFPEDSRWVKAAKERMPQDFAPSAAAWSDGERLRYLWKLPSGQSIGYSVSTMKAVERDGRELWRRENRYFINGHRRVVVEFDRATFRSVYSELISPEMGDIYCWYGPESETAKVEYTRNDKVQSFEFDGLAYDNEQAFELMRQLPMEVDYRAEVTVFVSLSGFHVDVVFHVTGIAMVETELGPRECYQVELSLLGPKQVYYFSTDESRQLVKFEAGGVTVEMVEADRLKPDSMRQYVNEGFGYTVTHPDSWVTVEDVQDHGETARQQYFLDPKATGGYLLYSDLNAAAPDAEPTEIQALLEQNKKDVKGTVNEDSVRYFEINGMPAASFEARLSQSNGEEAIYYAIIVKGEKRHFIFQAHARPEGFSEARPTFEAIAYSVREGQ